MAAGFRSERKDYRQFIENDGGIFHKHGVGKVRLGGERNNADTQPFEQLFVSAVLSLGCRQVDGLAVDERKFAMNYSWTDGARDGSKHDNRESLHENGAASGIVEGNREGE